MEENLKVNLRINCASGASWDWHQRQANTIRTERGLQALQLVNAVQLPMNSNIQPDHELRRRSRRAPRRSWQCQDAAQLLPAFGDTNVRPIDIVLHGCDMNEQISITISQTQI